MPVEPKNLIFLQNDFNLKDDFRFNYKYYLNYFENIFLLSFSINKVEKISKSDSQHFFLKNKLLLIPFFLKNSNGKSYVIENIGNQIIAQFLRIFLFCIKIKVIKPSLGLLPSVHIKKEIRTIGRLKNLFSKISLYRLLNYMTNEMYDYKLVCTTHHKKENNYNEIVIHSFDYDRFLEKKNSLKKREDIIVFLDQNEIEHPDYKNLRLIRKTEGNNYFFQVNNFLNLISKKTKKDVIIALHPTSNENKAKLIYDFETIKGKTFELVSKAKYVISNCSASLNFAVLLKKPIILFTNQDLNNYYHNYILGFQTELNLEIYDASKTKDFNLEKVKIDKKLYNNYIEKYIKENIMYCNGSYSYELILNYLKKDDRKT